MTRLGRRAVVLFGLTATMAFSPLTMRVSGADTLKTEVEFTTKEIGSKENALGSLIADALREGTKADAAFIAASYFNADVKLSKGDVSPSDILKALEYAGDSVVIVNLTGAQIVKALEHGLFLYPKSNPGFLHFSGLTVKVDGEAAREKRVLSVKLDGDALQNGKTYKVAMPAPLANGALAYFKVWKKEDIDKKSEKELDGKTLESVIRDYLKDKKKLDKGDERLTLKEK